MGAKIFSKLKEKVAKLISKDYEEVRFYTDQELKIKYKIAVIEHVYPRSKKEAIIKEYKKRNLAA